MPRGQYSRTEASSNRKGPTMVDRRPGGTWRGAAIGVAGWDGVGTPWEPAVM
jgi:hypothetical protein